MCPAPEPHWRRTGRRSLYEGRVVVSEHSVELPSGEKTTFEVDESIPFAVAVLIAPSQDTVILARQYRYAIDSWIYDLPGGAGNPGEDPEDAARRECREETGLIPDILEHLHTIYPNPGRSAWALHLYFANTLDFGEANTCDPSEQVVPFKTSLGNLDRLIQAGSRRPRPARRATLRRPSRPAPAPRVVLNEMRLNRAAQSLPGQGSACGRPIGSKGGLRRAAVIAEKVARWPSLIWIPSR